MDYRGAIAKILIILIGYAVVNDCNAIQVEQDWWETIVLYQIYPRSFMDSNGDGIGDLKGIISKLPHLKASGIQATWLSPIFKSPMVDFGYDISDFTAIQDEYGTMEDFDELLKEADKLGIKIFLDFVPNHSSDKCEWFIKSVNRDPAYEDFYVWSDGIKGDDGKMNPPNNWVSVFYGSAWTWNEKRKQFYLHQFAAGQPDLNYRNPKVLQAMDNVLKFWLNKGVAGFRVDAVNHIYEVEDLRDEPETGTDIDPNSYGYLKHIYTVNLAESLDVIYHWRELMDNYKAEHGGDTRIMLTEAYANISFTMEYYENKDGRKGSQVPFNFLLVADLDKDSDARDFTFNIQKWITYMPSNCVANWVLGNHDQPRVGTRYGKERIDAMNILLMTLPGIAVTYNGEEIGMMDYRDILWKDTKDPAALNTNPEVYKKYSRDPVRTPFQWDDTKNSGFSNASKTWLPVHPDYRTTNLAMQLNEERSHYKVYQRLIEIRKQPTMQRGNFNIMPLNRNVLAYTRTLRGHSTIAIVINLGVDNQIVDLNILGEFPKKVFIICAGSASTYREGLSVETKNIILGPYESLILRGQIFGSNEKREMMQTIIKSANFILVALVLYRLSTNKWTQLSIYKS